MSRSRFTLKSNGENIYILHKENELFLYFIIFMIRFTTQILITARYFNVNRTCSWQIRWDAHLQKRKPHAVVLVCATGGRLLFSINSSFVILSAAFVTEKRKLWKHATQRPQSKLSILAVRPQWHLHQTTPDPRLTQTTPTTNWAIIIQIWQFRL